MCSHLVAGTMGDLEMLEREGPFDTLINNVKTYEIITILARDTEVCMCCYLYVDLYGKSVNISKSGHKLYLTVDDHCPGPNNLDCMVTKCSPKICDH